MRGQMQMNVEKLTQYIDEKSIIVTPNRRLASYLRGIYDHEQLQTCKQSWPAAKILPFTTYLEETWLAFMLNAQLEPLHLLNTHQENYIFESIITAWDKDHLLLQQAETAHLVKSAWQLLKQWQVKLNNDALQVTENKKTLLQWLQAFQAKCRNENLLDRASIIDEIIKSSNDDAQDKLLFYGFNEITPQVAAYMSWHKNAFLLNEDFFLIETQLDNKHFIPNIKTSKITFAEQEEEIYTAARFAYQACCKGKKVAVIIPDLQQHHARLQQIFTEVFKQDRSGFNISAGKYLSQYPLIHTALSLLKFNTDTLSAELLQLLLMSPFIGEAHEELAGRNHFEEYIQRENFHLFKPSILINQDSKFTKHFKKYSPKLYQRLIEFYDHASHHLNKHARCKEWARQFIKILSIFGWPGERSMNSEEYQTVEQWRQLLLQFETLDVVTGPLSYHQALKIITRMAARELYQPMTPDAPVQVLGLLEASGSFFDTIWLTGMDDRNWPPSPSPHPLLPKAMQRRLRMPHASSEREFEYCNQLLYQFQKHCEQLICSYAALNEGIERQESAFITQCAQLQLSNFLIDDFIPEWQQIYRAKTLEYINDETAPAITEHDRLSGGQRVIQNQSLCPFRAFAECRLNAFEVASTTLGLNPKQRGIFVHKALELLWKSLKNSNNLLTIDREDLEQMLKSVIDTAKDLLELPETRLVTLEKERLYQLLQGWLREEMKRDAFEVILNEEVVEIQLGALKLSLRIDRIDQLSTGERMVIDYKTKKYTSINAFFGTRPDDPQLPLYALLDPDTIGISYAQLAKGQYQLNGISAKDLNIEGITTIEALKHADGSNWIEQMHAWKENLQSLATDFINGIASVSPKNQSTTCTNCHLQRFCRIHEEH